MASASNPNWGKCLRCGTPLLIDPKTNQMEPCANCESLDSPTGGFFAGFFLVIILFAMGYLIYFCIKMLLW